MIFFRNSHHCAVAPKTKVLRFSCLWRGTGSCQRVNIRATQAQTSAEIPPHSP